MSQQDEDLALFMSLCALEQELGRKVAMGQGDCTESLQLYELRERIAAIERVCDIGHRLEELKRGMQ